MPRVSEPCSGAPFLSAHQHTPTAVGELTPVAGGSCTANARLTPFDWRSTGAMVGMSAADLPRHWTGLQDPVSGSQRGWNQAVDCCRRLPASELRRRRRSQAESTEWENIGHYYVTNNVFGRCKCATHTRTHRSACRLAVKQILALTRPFRQHLYAFVLFRTEAPRQQRVDRRTAVGRHTSVIHRLKANITCTEQKRRYFVCPSPCLT